MMRILRKFTLFLILITTFVFAACGKSSDSIPSTAITITDSLGREVTLPALPKRIVIAGKANFMINDAVYLFPQAPEKVTALTQARQATKQFISLMDGDYEEKARFTLNSSAEEIATAQPDLVLLKTLMQQTLGQDLEQLDIPVIYVGLETPEEYERDIAVLGQVFGDKKRAEEIWEYYQTILDKITITVSELADDNRPSVMVIQHNSSGGEQAFQVPPTSWIQTQLVELAGGTPVWREAAQGNWAVVNFEQIAAWNPEQIYVLSYFENPENVVNDLKFDPKWQELAAVQNDKVYGFPKDYYSWDQPDTRWGLGLTWLAQHIHATEFPDLDSTLAFYEFYSELYGLDVKVINQHIVPLVQGEIIIAYTSE